MVGSVEVLGSVLGATDWLGSEDGAELGSVDDVALALGWVDGACDGLLEPPERPSLTWLIVVPWPPEMAWPLITSKAVMPAYAITKTAAALTRMPFQGRRRILPRPSAGSPATVGTPAW